MSVIEQLSPAFVWFRMKVGSYLQAKQDELTDKFKRARTRHALDRNNPLASQEFLEIEGRLEGFERRAALMRHILRI